MHTLKTKAVKNIEQRMEDLDRNSIRYHILESAKNFKTSWIALGRSLYSVWKDKMYKEWGYSSFEAYTAKEIGIRKQTAMKLLKSYFFLEKEEPRYLKKDYTESAETAKVPSYESVNVLRLAQNRKILDDEDYANLREKILKYGKDAGEIKKDLTAIIKQREELEPEAAREKKRLALLRRMLNTLKSLKEEAQVLKMLPAPIIKEVATLIKKLESELS